MEDLKTLFAKRDERYSEETLKIFGQTTTTIECVTAYLSDVDERIRQGVITWEEINIMDDMIVVIGMVMYEPGNAVTLSGVEYTVTEQNVDEFQSIVHMSVPYDLVIAADPDAIMQFLYDMGQRKGNEDFVIPMESTQPPTEPTTSSDFDLSELSEDQLQSLKISTGGSN